MNESVTNILRNLTLALSIGLIFITTTALRYTDVEGFTDPAYTDYTFDKVALDASGTSVEFRKHLVKKLTKAFKKRGVELVNVEKLLPPTREWTAESAREALIAAEIDALLSIQIEGYDADSEVLGVQTNQTTYKSPSRYGADRTTGNATVLSKDTDSGSFRAELLDVDKASIAWVADINTRGSGKMFVGPKSTASGVTKGIIEELDKARHTSKKKK